MLLLVSRYCTSLSIYLLLKLTYLLTYLLSRCARVFPDHLITDLCELRVNVPFFPLCGLLHSAADADALGEALRR